MKQQGTNETEQNLKLPNLKRNPRMSVPLESKRNKLVKKIAQMNQSFRKTHGMEKDIKRLNFTEQETLTIYPNEIIFKDIIPGQIYQMKAKVKNLSKVVRRIRVFQPKSPEFRCDYEMVTAIAPGLSIDLIISFEATEKGEYKDNIKIVSGSYEKVIPMLAYSPMAKIIFEPFINMGFIQVGGKKTEVVIFKNEGTEKGKVSLAVDGSDNLSIQPETEFDLAPGAIKEVQLVYDAQDSGLYRGVVNVTTNGKTFLETIDINATCVEYSQFIIDKNGKELPIIQFGDVIFGHKKKISGFLVNNSPEGLYFKVNFLQGHFDMYEEENNILSPHEVGHEQTMRILSMEPRDGYVESYAQIPVTFVCKTEVKEDHKIWTKNNCLAKNELKNTMIKREYEYTSVYFFSKSLTSKPEDSLTKIIKMKAVGICPQIKFSENTIDFSKCEMGESIDKILKIYNESNSSVFAEGISISQFHTKPRKLRLGPYESKEVVIKFTPKNLGKTKLKCKFVINGKYDCVINLEGTGVRNVKKNQKTKKKTSMSLRSLNSRNKLESGISLRDKKLKQKGKGKMKYHQFQGKGLLKSASTANGFLKKKLLPKMKDVGVKMDVNGMTTMEIYNPSQKKLGYTTGDAFRSSMEKRNRNQSQNMNRKGKKIDYLRESRINRLKMRKERSLKRQMDNLKSKIQERIPNYYQKKKSITNTQASDRTQPDVGHNQLANHGSSQILQEDMKFLFNPNYDGLDSPRLNYPEQEKFLFVTKPIGKYQPQESAINMLFDPDPNMEVKPLPSKPFGHKVTRDINKRLDGEMLKHIHAGPKVLEYGDLFVNSISDKYFFVRNSLKNAIIIRVVLDEYVISSSYEKPQILLSGQSAGFRIRFKSSELGYVSKIIKYLINEKHEFKFMVKANVTRVNLNVSKKKLDIGFSEDNLGLEAYENIHLTNRGNADAIFRWYSPNQSFTFVPEREVVKPGTSMPVKVYYRPNNKKLYEEENVDLIVEDGETMTIQVTGSVEESKCEIEPKVLDFGSLAVGESSDLKLELENIHSKNSCIYHIDMDSVPSFLSLSKKNGKIYPQSVDKIMITFKSNVPKQFEGNIRILIRGNRSIKVPFTAGVIIPKIVVYEDIFNFGKITYGNNKTMQMTIENTSPILAKMRVDFRSSEKEENRGVECLSIEQIRESQDDSYIIEEVEHEYLKMLENAEKKKADEDGEFEDMKKKEDEDADSYLSRDDTISQGETLEILEEDGKKVKYFVLTLKPNKIYKFELTFHPKRTMKYDFFLPFYAGSNTDFNPEIQKRVICSSVPPKILMNPMDGVRDFKKIVITHMERNLPKKKTLTIKNPDPLMALSFFINDEILEEERVFFLSKNEGSILPKESIDIVVTFNPHIPGAWEFSLPLYLDDDRDNKKSEILLKGESAYPKLYFDRRQIILPVVPLNIESRSVFRIINDGFQNVTIGGEVSEDYSTALAPINIKFMDGISMNLRKKVLKVEISFKSKTPISFTARLDFKDDKDGIWSIYCSGTADNCLLTSCFYFMRNLDEQGEITREAGYSINYKIKEIETEKSEDSMRVRSAAAVSKMSLNSAEGNLGYSPIPMDVLEEYCQTISFWLSETIPHISVSLFPDDIIQENGRQLLDALHFLTKKSYGSPMQFKSAEKQSERAPKLHEFYSSIINRLKEEGAYLCDIRPEFLMDFQQLIFHIKNNEVANSHKVTHKLNEAQFRYISYYSWAVLFNQILKLFYLSRVNLNRFRHMKGLTSEQKKIDRRYLTNSNVYSQSELLLLRWCEISLQEVKKQNNRHLILFDKHFKSGIVYACILQHFSDKFVRPLAHMRDIALTEQDCRVNMTAVKSACADLGLNAVPTLENLLHITPIHSLLFLCNLFQVMPFYMPKELVEFECALNDHIVKRITISNPTSYKMSYIPVITGSEDFEIDQDSILIEPKSKKYEFPVKFYARLTRPVMARLCFKGLSDGKVQAAPIVYDLISKVTKRRSVGREEIHDVQLFGQSQRVIFVENPFQTDVEFEISIHHLKSIKQRSKGFGGYEPKEGDANSLASRRNGNRQINDLVIPSFFLSSHKVYIKKGKKAKIRFQYIPITFEIHMCHIVFTDSRIGEIQYDLVGTPLLPPPLQVFTYQTSLDEHENHSLLISTGYKAKADAYSRLASQIRKIKSNRLKEHVQNFLDQAKESELFSIELANGAKEISLPNDFRLYDVTSLMANDEEKLKRLNAKGDINNLPLGLNFRTPVNNYSCMFLMRNSDYTDLRVYEVIITVLPKVFKANLNFNSSARLPITQRIPVTNGAKNEVNFEVSKMDVVNGKDFIVDKNLSVRRESTGYLNVVYKPEWLEESEARITIRNPATQEKFEYSFKGKSDEPLAEDHLKFKCDVGQSMKHVIPFKNTSSQTQNFTVKYDLHSVSGLREFRLHSNKTHHYELEIKPNLGGIYAGMITFTDSNGHYWWYSMELESKGLRNVREYEVSSEIRKEAVLEIPIQNKFDEKIEYSVLVRGKYIYGPARFKVNPLAKEYYKLSFLPFEVSVIEENSVTFTNPKSGEIFCVVKTTGRDKTVEKLPIFRAEIGKSFQNKITLTNPCGMRVKVSSSISNPENFEISPSKFEIPPYGTFSPMVKYIPNQIDTQKKCDIVFQSDNIGDWKFTAFGKGENPTDFKEREITALLKKEGSTVITFTNPFKNTIIINIELQVERATLEEVKRNGGVAPPSPFRIHFQKPKISLQAGKTFQVPISFIPQQITEYRCKLVLKLNDQISWVYPIRLVTEAAVNEKELVMTTVCRKKKEKKFTIELEGVNKIFPDDEFEIELDDLKVKKSRLEIMRKWFKVLEYYVNADFPNSLTFVIKFNPQKPFKEIGMLKISRNRGGIWRFKVKLESVEPPVLDKIVIESPLNVTSTAQFKLTNGNNLKMGSPFVAEFSHESASEFNVYPKKGILQPMIKNGTMFNVTFTPVEYGKMKVGKLIIQTATRYWSFRVEGTFPKYEPPKIEKISNLSSIKVKKEVENKFGRIGGTAKKSKMMG